MVFNPLLLHVNGVTLGNLLQFSEAQFCFGYLVHVGTLQKVFDE